MNDIEIFKDDYDLITHFGKLLDAYKESKDYAIKYNLAGQMLGKISANSNTLNKIIQIFGWVIQKMILPNHISENSLLNRNIMTI